MRFREDLVRKSLQVGAFGWPTWKRLTVAHRLEWGVVATCRADKQSAAAILPGERDHVVGAVKLEGPVVHAYLPLAPATGTHAQVHL